ncbi:MAG: phage tail protein, partial [Pseudomonadota bacterium]
MAIFTAIAGAISGALFAGSALATQIIAAGLSIGANLALSYLGREKAQTYSALQGEKEYGAAVPMTAAFGRVLVAGHEIEYFNYGKGDKYNTFVLALSNGWCHGLQPEIIFFGKSHTLTPIATIGNETQHFEVANFNSKIKIRFYDGRPDQAADAKLIADTAGLSNPWSATDTVTGHAYVIVDMEYDDTLYEDGFPEFQFILDGLRLYDPRKDSTFAGGSGTHRLADPATWEWSDNPAIQRLNYLIGPVVGQISGRTLIGMGKVVGQIDMTSHITAANVADQTRSIDGRTVKTYHANIIVNSTMDHTEVLKEFEDAMAGYALNNAGLSGVVVGAPQVPVMALTDLDIRVDEGREVSYRQSAFSAVNLLSGSYTSPVSLWQAEAFKPVTVNADVQADGRQREERNDFLQVIDADIAQYLAHIRYRQNRLAGKATLPVSARFGHQVAAGGWITWAGRTWLITGWKLSNALKVTLTLAETSLAVYSETDIQPGPIYSPPIAPVNPSQISTVSDFAVAVGSIQGDGFNQTPALLVTWTPPEDPTVTDVIVSYWDQAAPGTVYQLALPEPESGEATITQ